MKQYNRARKALSHSRKEFNEYRGWPEWSRAYKRSHRRARRRLDRISVLLKDNGN